MIKAKKSLGQNWLKSESAIREIMKAGELKAGDCVLEIGPGRGALTKELLGAGAKVLAIEKDDNLINPLQEKFASEIKSEKLIILHADVLDLNLTKTLKKQKINSYKLIANIPYYITGQIIRKFLSEEKIQPTLMVLMLQKEVAKRIIGNSSSSARETDKESILSLSVKVYGEPKYIKTVPAGAFEPKPNVDSAILQIKNISKKFFTKTEDEKKFFGIIKKGFAQKRKLLKGNLGVGEDILGLCKIPLQARAEDLKLENWKCLTQKIKD
ncbi:MAG TPA: 16S rRNA (adenine(1518)-N(6)/adenine(1519)-N(6))-dimethyltransferase RsmA [Candidatus Paceibacterota bacterium]|nr:16S rRNA (adenine(1518)-N(6)/adenine(1519)-N(6))-dimethyltransferase RsmA [Candidatus Paceibacterota bacterium]